MCAYAHENSYEHKTLQQKTLLCFVDQPPQTLSSPKNGSVSALNDFRVGVAGLLVRLLESTAGSEGGATSPMHDADNDDNDDDTAPTVEVMVGGKKPVPKY